MFQTLMNNIFGKYIDDFVIVYIDDILMYSKTREDHKKRIQIVIDELRKNKIYAKLSKCFFMKNRMEYLGHAIPQNVTQVNPKKDKWLLENGKLQLQ